MAYAKTPKRRPTVKSKRVDKATGRVRSAHRNKSMRAPNLDLKHKLQRRHP